MPELWDSHDEEDTSPFGEIVFTIIVVAILIGIAILALPAR